MTKRVFRGILLTALLASVLVSLFIGAALYTEYENRLKEELRAEAGYLRYALSRAEDEQAYFSGFTSGNRVTLVAPDGSVLYDSGANAAKMLNHADRPEIAQALADGTGESRRYSDTLSETTVYYAVKTARGSVLRVSNTRASVLGLIAKGIPLFFAALAAVAALSYAIARSVAKRVVAPINALDLESPLENDVYDELSPLLSRMDRQRKEIIARMEELRVQRTEMTAIVESMREGLIVLDAKGRVLSINESAARVFGASAQTRVGGDILSVTRDPEIRAAAESAKSGLAADALFESGGRQYQLFASPVSRGGETLGAVLLTLDITERLAAEASRREFTANVSHELKTPLTSISGYAEILRDGVAKPEDTRGFAARIFDEAARLIALVNDILRLSQLDERRGLGQREEISLLALARATLSRARPLAEAKGLRIALEGEAGEISGYKPLLEEAIFNLIDNAIRYTPDGGRVSVAVAEDSGAVSITVSDTGIGIPPEHQSRVFERFYRVDKSHSKATGGTGLGLSIVKHVASVHSADIALVSETGKGTSIRLSFPRRHAQI